MVNYGKMTVCNVKSVTYSDEKRIITSAVGRFSLFQLIVLV